MVSLIAYFSRRGDNYVNGEIKNLSVGNTETVATLLHDVTGADLFQIEPVVPYSMDYSECIEQAKQDKRRDARPELKAWLESLDVYDTIYLGYPNYWGTMPMAVFTFLEHYDFSGKTIKPFCTQEGSNKAPLMPLWKSMAFSTNRGDLLPRDARICLQIQ